MPNPTEINLLDYHFEAKACNAVLTVMLNQSNRDYSTLDELHKVSELALFNFDEMKSTVYMEFHNCRACRCLSRW